jgi:hypothetical protein
MTLIGVCLHFLAFDASKQEAGTTTKTRGWSASCNQAAKLLLLLVSVPWSFQEVEKMYGRLTISYLFAFLTFKAGPGFYLAAIENAGKGKQLRFGRRHGAGLASLVLRGFRPDSAGLFFCVNSCS